MPWHVLGFVVMVVVSVWVLTISIQLYFHSGKKHLTLVFLPISWKFPSWQCTGDYLSNFGWVTQQGSLYICACSEPVIMGDRSPLNIISSPGRKQQYNILSSASAHNCDYAVLKTQATVCIFKCILNAVTQFTGPKSLLSGIQRCPVKYLNLSFDDVLHCIWR